MVELDPNQLRRRLAGAGVAGVTPLSGGASSLTFRGALDGRPVVIKVAPPSVDPVAHRDVLRQARIIKALGGTRVPVPALAGMAPPTAELVETTNTSWAAKSPTWPGSPPWRVSNPRRRGR